MVKKIGQPEVSIGLIGHVDHGKTTLLERLSGVWADTHSEEKKRGITIRLGYADAVFYKCKECKEPECFTTKKKCEVCKSDCEPLRKVSFVDAPGHETLMATMLGGAAIIDGALLLVAANEKCPQPQTKEHLMALEILGVKNIVIVQNKIDLVSEDDALKNYKEIKEFVKGTIAEKSPVIPISAQHSVNINVLIQNIEDIIKTPKRDLIKEPFMLIARSFDVNKPGDNIEELKGGVLGGSLKQGKLKVGDEIEIKPGLKKEKEGKIKWQSIFTKISGLRSGGESLKEVIPGGSIGILTQLDPSIVKADNLTGSVVGLKNKLPGVWYDFNLRVTLLERVVGTKEELKVEAIKKGEPLMLNVNAAVTVGIVNEIHKDKIHVNLKVPICGSKEDRITISRRLGNRFRLIGYGYIV